VEIISRKKRLTCYARQAVVVVVVVVAEAQMRRSRSLVSQINFSS